MNLCLSAVLVALAAAKSAASFRGLAALFPGSGSAPRLSYCTPADVRAAASALEPDETSTVRVHVFQKSRATLYPIDAGGGTSADPSTAAQAACTSGGPATQAA